MIEFPSDLRVNTFPIMFKDSFVIKSVKFENYAL